MIDQEEMDTLDLDENGCAPDCPIRILGEQSGVSKSDAHIRHNGKGRQGYGINNRAFETSGVVDQGTASRYFKTFRPMVDDPDDETPQERGETQLLNSDDSQYDELPIDQVIHGDCLEALKTLPDNSVDSICTDPPYGMGTVKDIAGLLLAWIQDEDDSKHLGKSGFMGKEWDAGVPGPRYWREALRVLKPGGHILAFSSTRTYDLLVIALRLAGFECRDQISWLFGSGFPKSTDISKQIDRMAGQEREVVGRQKATGNARGKGAAGHYANGIASMTEGQYEIVKDGWDITAPATPEAAQWAGWGTNLKPSHEPICLARKPLAEKTIAAQVLATGTGALNIDISRIGANGEVLLGGASRSASVGASEGWDRPWRHDSEAAKQKQERAIEAASQGKRFPSNTLFSHTERCQARGEKRVRGTAPGGKPSESKTRTVDGNLFGLPSYGEYRGYTDSEGMETVAAYSCAPDCPVRLLDQQSGVRKSGGGVKVKAGSIIGNGTTHGHMVSTYESQPCEPSEGGASRYFKTFPPVEDMVPFTYQSKASRKDRSSNGVVNNTHPTCKPMSLMKYLCNMITPPNGVILDMFAGSGSTGVAAAQCGFHYILIEQEQEYIDICRARLAHARASVPRPVEQEAVEYDCAPGCPVAELGRQSGVRKSEYSNPESGKRQNGKNYGVVRNHVLGERISQHGSVYSDAGTAARFFKTFPPEPTLWDMAEEDAPS